MLAVIGTIAVIGSVLALALQARELAKQSRLANEQARFANEVAAVEAHRQLVGQIDGALAAFIQYPELRPHFFGERVSRPPTASQEAQLVTLAEIYCDALQVILATTEHLRGYAWNTEPWTIYTRETIASSPVIRETLEHHPTWWPPLDAIRRSLQDTSDPDGSRQPRLGAGAPQTQP